MSNRVELEAIAGQWISLWCTPVDWGLFDRLHAPDFEDCSAVERATTKEAFAAALADLVRAFPDLRATLDEGRMVDRLIRLRNVVPMLSLEGTAEQTDERRGPGTYRRLMQVMGRLKEESLFFGCSLTLTSQNFSKVLDEAYVRELVRSGCRFFLFLDYTPVDESTAGWVLTDAQRKQVMSRIRNLRRCHPALFIAVPWDEQEVGGCLNLKDVSLGEGLGSSFLAGLRAMPELSQYVGGGCALWKNREQVEQVLMESGNGILPGSRS